MLAYARSRPDPGFWTYTHRCRIRENSATAWMQRVPGEVSRLAPSRRGSSPFAGGQMVGGAGARCLARATASRAGAGRIATRRRRVKSEIAPLSWSPATAAIGAIAVPSSCNARRLDDFGLPAENSQDCCHFLRLSCTSPYLSPPVSRPTLALAPHPNRRPLAMLTALLLALLVATPLAAEDAASVEARMSGVVEFLASDELEGRGIDTAGLPRAARYLAEEFEAAGLETALYDGSPLQKFTITTSAKLGPAAENHLAFVGPPAEVASPQEAPTKTEIVLQLERDFRTMAAGGSAQLEDVPLVFVGYGITAPDMEYDDYADIDVEGKAVIVLRHQPRWGDPHSPFGSGPSRHAFFRTKISNAFEHGAKAVLLCTTAAEIDRQVAQHQERWQVAVDRLAQTNAEFKAIENPTAEQLAEHIERVRRQAQLIQEFAERIEEQRDPVLAFHRAGEGGNREGTPVFHVRRAVLDELFEASLGRSLDQLEEDLDKTLRPNSQELKGWSLRGEATIERRRVEVSNVVGVLEGEGPLADETIVIGAHYDHLGRGESGAFDPENREIHNGADDNSSGVAALLEIARQLVAHEQLAGRKLARRVVFIAFTGEERGLLGSAHYIQNPLFPLEKTVAMLNLDMVGRLTDNKLIVHGTGTAKRFDELVDRLNVIHEFEITKSPSGFGPSDHASFYARQIPALHFFTGAHRDYHRPSDDFDKINVPGMRRVALMVADMAVAISDNESRPEYLATQQPTRRRGGTRPYFGSIPDFAGDKEGYAISGASPGSPAARGGLEAGDVIIRFGDSRIANLEDFDSALRKYKSGDTVKVVVRRGDDDVTLEVTLDPPR
ncbi:MAG: M20/M25/M40 family metallo-hydrolase [Planctomycetota bacterium]|nr:MAG: M20/M25/M40 family metallo-hydrolase [Planctomycetota bacterium]REJ88092.1 MAG: M20/M25/M40 family metallo-hydrolase [Planctomycetota bacterium]